MDEVVKEQTQAQAPVETTPVATEAKGKSMAINAGSFDKTFEELKQLQTSVKKFKAGDLLVPMLSLISLALLTIFVYIPMITAAIDNRDEVAEIKGKINTLERLNDDLNAVDQIQLQVDLANSRKVIPFSLQVSDFLYYIDNSAKAKGLEFKEIIVGDVLISGGEKKTGIESLAKGVSGPVKYGGTLTQITNFLDEIQTVSPYIVSADQIKLRQPQGGENWEVSLTTTGYYIDEKSLKTPGIYDPFTFYYKNTQIIELFATKANRSQ